MTVLNETFQAGEQTIHAVLLRQGSKLRWNAYLWGAGLSFANSFARRENAEKWLARLIRQHFPSLGGQFSSYLSPALRGPRKRRGPVVRKPVYRRPAQSS